MTAPTGTLDDLCVNTLRTLSIDAMERAASRATPSSTIGAASSRSTATLFAPAVGTARGAYVLVDTDEGLPELILIAKGSELSLALEAHRTLVGEGVRSRVVSMPSWELFEAQSAEYREAVLPAAVHARISVEAGSPFGWERYVGPAGAILGVDGFGASAPGPEVMARYGFTVEHVVATAKAVLERRHP